MSEFIDSQEWRPRHHLIVSSVAAAWAFMASCVSGFPYILDELRSEFDIDRWTVALAAGCLLAGAIPGTLLGGTLSDISGRRSVIFVALLSGSLVALAHFLIVALWQLILIRLVLGIFFGVLVAVLNVYLVEFVPSDARGWCVCIAGLGWKVGGIFSIGLAWLVGGHWRIVLSGPIIPGLIAATLFLCWAPESPRWLLVHGREDDASMVLQRLFGLDDPPKVHSVCGKTVPVESESKLRSVWVRIEELFGPALRLVTALALVIWVVNIGVGYAWGLWGPEIVRLLLRAEEIPYAFFIWSEVINGVAQFAYAFALDHIGRRPVIVGGTLAVSGFMALLLAVPRERLAVFAIIVMIDLPWSLAWHAKIAYTKEAFATEVRGTATGLFNFFGRISGASLPILVGFLLGFSIAHGVLTMIALLLVAGGTACLIPVETCRQPMKDVLSPRPFP